MLFRMDIHKKTLNIDHSRLKRVRRLLGASTDTSTIHMAFDWVLSSQSAVDDLLAVAGKGAGKFRKDRRQAKNR
jgi:hypothetical protein